MKRRVGLIQAMLTEPRILIVDEPTAGLDPEERIRIRNLLSDFSKDKIIILSTHVVEDVASICENVCILNGGKVKYSGKVNNLIDIIEGHTYTCSTNDENELLEIRSKYSITSQIYSGTSIKIKFVSKEIPNIESVACEGTIEVAYIFVNEIEL